MSNTKKEENFDPSKVEKLSFKEILKKIGPGIILSGIVIGPGAITTAANLGASYGYSLMWIYLLVGFMGSVYVLTTYRLAMLTGMPTLHAIRNSPVSPCSLPVCSSRWATFPVQAPASTSFSESTGNSGPS